MLLCMRGMHKAPAIADDTEKIKPIDWPAMTMGFKATPEQLAQVQVVQQTMFEFTSEGMQATLLSIKPM
ncbi:heavy metal efflux system protein [Pseudomonas luteola]|uniref:Heavy metal efflux system protein n=2 Tax=Pseudomonas luteola TaxID=47886 RepID=A0A2X2CDS1_PSELU|nr:heavy metal efflux system protein [Pseudomonas luteola]